MRYLAISKTPYYVAYAVFQDKYLVDYGKVHFIKETPSKRLVELSEMVVELIERWKPQFILTHLIE